MGNLLLTFGLEWNLLWKVVLIALGAIILILILLSIIILYRENKQLQEENDELKFYILELANKNHIHVDVEDIDNLPDTIEEPIVVVEKNEEIEEKVSEPVLVEDYDYNSGMTIYYRYGFWAKLIVSEDDIKEFYGELMNIVATYPKVKTRLSFSQLRIYKGRVTYARVFFRGRRICLSYALNPNDYSETKYRGIDVSEIKKLEDTPMMLKITSDRRKKYAKELLVMTLDNAGLTRVELEEEPKPFKLRKKSLRTMLNEGLVKRVERRSSDITSRNSLSEDDELDFVEDEFVQENQVLEPEVTEEPVVETEPEVNAYNVDEFVSDEQVEEAIVRKTEKRTGKMAIVNLDRLSIEFNDGDTVDLEAMIKKHIVSRNTKRVKILARGSLNKKLHVEADDFSKQAMKLIIYCGGSVTVIG